MYLMNVTDKNLLALKFEEYSGSKSQHCYMYNHVDTHLSQEECGLNLMVTFYCWIEGWLYNNPL